MFSSFFPNIDGLDSLLPGEMEVNNAVKVKAGAIKYYPVNGLNMVVYGPPGVGKTILALQMACAARNDNKRVIYLTKDTTAEAQFDRMANTFNFFGIEGEKIFPEDAVYTLKDKVLASETAKESGNKVLYHYLNGCMNECNKYSSNGEQSRVDDFWKEVYGEWKKPKGFFFVEFSELPAALGKVDRYAKAKTIYQALGHLQPELRPLFDKMEMMEKDENLPSENMPEWFIVCDSIAPEDMEESLRLQQTMGLNAASENRGTTTTGLPRKPLVLFIMEAETIPANLSVAFPPDVQICLGSRDETHKITSRTIQLVKTRFQKSLQDVAPYVILSKEDTDQSVAMQRGLDPLKKVPLVPSIEEQPGEVFTKRCPGLTIMPPFAHDAADRLHEDTPNSGMGIKFNIKALDEFTHEKMLAGGGCTLLVTQSQTKSTLLGLHYLLGQAGGGVGELRIDSIPQSLLYICFSDEAEEILQTIWRFPILRTAFVEAKAAPEETWGNLKQAIDLARDQQKNKAHRHRLYTLRLTQLKKVHAYLYIYVPDFSWLTAEEAMSHVVRLLDYPAKNDRTSVPIGRIVLDRVGCLQARWPLVENCQAFVSSLVAMCNRHQRELLLVDDTATDGKGAGEVDSHWRSMAQNILRLRRLSFHGTGTTAVELIRASGKRIKHKRPHEAIVRGEPNKNNETLEIEDSFRGYTHFASGEPERCEVKVDLSYDTKFTPLHHEALTTKQYLETAMDNIVVRLPDRNQWSGINSAFNNLTGESRATCHIVAIDGVWLQPLLAQGRLHRLANSDLMDDGDQGLWPEHICARNHKRRELLDKCKGNKDNEVQILMNEEYVTESITMAMALADSSGKSKISGDLGYHYAVPMRHNWGVLAVTKLSPNFIKLLWKDEKVVSENAFSTIFEKIQKLFDEVKAPGKDKSVLQGQLKVLRMLFGDCFDRVIEDPLGKMPMHSAIIGNIRTSLEPIVPNPSWGDIATFRVKCWDDWVASLPNNQHDNSETRWDVNFFGLSMSSEESVVSFFLELLLTHIKITDLFVDEKMGDPSIPFFSFRFAYNKADDPDTEKNVRDFARVLLLFYQLLSPSLRRYIGIGLRTVKDVNNDKPDRDTKIGGATPKNEPQGPKQIFLISRQWLTTIEDLEPRNDIREDILMRHLPAGDKDATSDFWRNLGYKDEGRHPFHSWGPTVAGTWYLGILKGGNADLGKDVMKVILSKEHEAQRLMDRSGAPVSTYFYSEKYSKPSDPDLDPDLHPLPYAGIIRKIYIEDKVNLKPESTDPRTKGHFFPFYRTQIKNYMEVSDILYDLIRHVMRLHVKKEGDWINEIPDNEGIYSTELHNNIVKLVKVARGRLQMVGGVDA